jgi:hypothetical protein
VLGPAPLAGCLFRRTHRGLPGYVPSVTRSVILAPIWLVTTTGTVWPGSRRASAVAGSGDVLDEVAREREADGGGTAAELGVGRVAR